MTTQRLQGWRAWLYACVLYARSLTVTDVFDQFIAPTLAKASAFVTQKARSVPFLQRIMDTSMSYLAMAQRMAQRLARHHSVKKVKHCVYGAFSIWPRVRQPDPATLREFENAKRRKLAPVDK
jgi:hypothetical protein